MNQMPPFSGSGILSRGRGAAELESEGARKFSEGQRDPGELRSRGEAVRRIRSPYVRSLRLGFVLISRRALISLCRFQDFKQIPLW